MLRLVSTVVALFVAAVVLLVPRVALAFGAPTSNEYHYGKSRVRWEHDKGRCPTYESTCFVYGAPAIKLSTISRPTDAGFALGQLAEGGSPDLRAKSPGTWHVFDPAGAVVFTADDEARARARFVALTGTEPEMLRAADGAPRRPTLWRTASSFIDDAPELVFGFLLFGIYLWPLYLALMFAWAFAWTRGNRDRPLPTRALVTTAAIVTSPLAPLLSWFALAVLAA